MGRHTAEHLQQQTNAPDQLAPQPGGAHFDLYAGPGEPSRAPVAGGSSDFLDDSWFRVDTSTTAPAQTEGSTKARHSHRTHEPTAPVGGDNYVAPTEGAQLVIGSDTSAEQHGVGGLTFSAEPERSQSGKVREAVDNILPPLDYLAARQASRQPRDPETRGRLSKARKVAAVLATTAVGAVLTYKYGAGHVDTMLSNAAHAASSNTHPTGNTVSSFQGLHHDISDLAAPTGTTANNLPNSDLAPHLPTSYPTTEAGSGDIRQQMTDTLNAPATGNGQQLGEYDQRTGHGTIWNFAEKAVHDSGLRQADGKPLPESVVRDVAGSFLKDNGQTWSSATHLSPDLHVKTGTEGTLLDNIVASARQHNVDVAIDPNTPKGHLWNEFLNQGNTNGSGTGANHGSDLAPHLRPSYPTTENGDTGPVLHSRHVTAEPTVGGPGAPGSSDLPEAALGAAGAAALVTTGYIGRHRSQVRESDGAVLRPEGPRFYEGNPLSNSSREAAPIAVATPDKPDDAATIILPRTTVPQSPTPTRPPVTGRARRPSRRRGKAIQPNTPAQMAALTTRDEKKITLEAGEPAPSAQVSSPEPRQRRGVRQVVREAFPRYQRQDRGLGQIQPNTAKDLEGLLREPRQRPPIGTVPAGPGTPGSQPGENENNS
jgi:hypothetical protein